MNKYNDEKRDTPICCPTCNSVDCKATWFDLAKYKGKLWIIKGEVPFVEQDDAFDLDDLLNDEKNKIEGFDEEADEILLLSMDTNYFTQEEVQDMKFGDEDWGARCNNCGGIL